MNLYAFEIPQGGSLRKYLAVADPAQSNFTQSAIVGYLIDSNQPVVHSNIIYNPSFIDLFHKIVVLTALRSQDGMQGSVRQESGFVYIVDQRVERIGKDNPEDIIGSFEVVQGVIQPMSYSPNPKYQLISSAGLFKMPGDFDQFLEMALQSKKAEA